MNRYWVSWWSGYYADEGCSEPPFELWISGQRFRENEDPDSERDECSICAVIDAENEDDIWKSVAKHFPDYEERFCELRDQDFVPGDRFPGFENRTSLTAEVEDPFPAFRTKRQSGPVVIKAKGKTDEDS